MCVCVCVCVCVLPEVIAGQEKRLGEAERGRPAAVSDHLSESVDDAVAVRDNSTCT